MYNYTTVLVMFAVQLFTCLKVKQHLGMFSFAFLQRNSAARLQRYFRILDMAQYTMLKKAHMIEDTCSVLESAERKMKDKPESMERLESFGTEPDCSRSLYRSCSTLFT